MRKLNLTILVASSDVENSPVFTDLKIPACKSVIALATVFIIQQSPRNLNSNTDDVMGCYVQSLLRQSLHRNGSLHYQINEFFNLAV